MSSFVDFDDDDDTGLRREEIRAALADADNTFQRSRLIRGFADDVALAGIGMSPLALVFLSVVIALFVGLVLAVIGNAPIFLLLAFTGPIFLRMFVSNKVERKRRAFGDQLSDNLDVLAQSLRAGHSLPGALAVVAESAPEPSHEELARVISDERLGVPLEDALGSCVTRMQSRDLEQVALVALLQRDAGGNAAEVIDQVAYNIRTRQELRRLARTLTAQGRMTRWILTALPVFVFLGIYLIDRTYLSPLWETGAGKVGLLLGIVMVSLGSYSIKRIVDIKV
jgi:tight adherence protein B